MKSNQRLAYSTLSEVLGQRNLIDPQRLTLALQTSVQGTTPFPEVLVTEGLIGDWELSKTVCDLYSLPFLPVDICAPQAEARAGLNAEFLLRHRLVPVNRFGNLLVVAMPALVPAEVLVALTETHGVHIVPVVGSVQSNNRWLQDHLSSEVAPALPGSDDDWSNIFDEGNAAVLLDLEGEPGDVEEVELELLTPEPDPADEADEPGRSGGAAA